VVHRDFKPENIFVETLRTGKEHVKVLDFGIAKLRGDEDANLTSRGAVCGTPEYMSPEQIRGEDLDARSDVYAAGVVLYECMIGVRPFESHGPVIELLQAHLNLVPQRPRDRRPDLHIPRALEEVCMRALAKAAEDRYRSAAELKTAVDAAVRGLSGEHCATCGMPVPSTARFCPECGAVLRAPAAGGPESRRPTAEVPVPAIPLPLPLVGRESVLERLEGLAGDAILIVGAPGMGKSALVAAWARREREERVRQVVLVGADPSGAATPWYPLRRALAALLGIPVRPTAADLERAIAEHQADRTGLAELFGCGSGPTLPLDIRRRECEAAVLGTLRRVAATFVFEDVDRYDRPSRALLGKLVAQPGASTVLATASHAEALDVEVEVVRLAPLDGSAIETLRELGLPPGVAELSGGVPLAIEQWLRARVEGLRDSAPQVRAAALPSPARRFLEALVVGGGDVPHGLLAQAAGEGEGETVDDLQAVLDELGERGWLRVGEDGALEMSGSLRRRIYDRLPDERRRALHAALASLLAARGADPIVVGLHAYSSGDTAAVVALERAGDAARDGFDDDAATRWYRAALERGRQALGSGGGDEARQIRVALKLGIVLRYRGDVIQSEHVLRDALELANLRSDRWAQVQARRALARLAAHWQHYDRAREHLVAAVQAALGAGDPTVLAELYLELADTLVKLGDDDGAERELWEGMMLCTGGDGPEGDGGPEPIWRMLIALGEVARRGRQVERALSFGLHALRHAERVGPLARARAHAFLGSVQESLGRAAQAAEQRRAAVEELRRLGDRRATVEMLIELAEADTVDKLVAQTWVREAEALADQLGWSEGVSRSRAALALLR
jgi:serine/threonine-protein kinase